MEVLSLDEFDGLLRELVSRGFTLAGPTLRGDAIVFDRIRSIDDLPAGYTDLQKPGSYRVEKTSRAALFDHSVGAHSFKPFVFPPAIRLFTARRSNGSIDFEPADGAAPRVALIGVRPCDLAALELRDRISVDRDPAYTARRNNIFVVAVNCTRAGGNCFCASMGTGPAAKTGFDLLLTEVDGEFVVETGSDAGAAVLAAIPHAQASDIDAARAENAVRDAAAQMGRSIDISNLRETLYASADHPRWEETAKRCMTCGNCTMVCPTCFCTTVEDTTDLGGESAERWRRWDSCFTLSFSYVAGGSVRKSSMSRYRQWLTHKFAAWQDQFGTAGCVGCGRCITWCPSGIDLTEEIAAIRRTEA